MAKRFHFVNLCQGNAFPNPNLKIYVAGVSLHLTLFPSWIWQVNLAAFGLCELAPHACKSTACITSALLSFPPQSHFISALTVVFVNSKSLSSLKIDDTPVDDPSLKVLVANNSDTLKLLKMSSCPHVSPAGTARAVTPARVSQPRRHVSSLLSIVMIYIKNFSMALKPSL